jgi:hypothetical protein
MSLIRLNYFAGQILSTADFQAEQDYLIGRSRRHNLFMHGVGVASGLAITTSKKGGQPSIVISPGHAIDPRGNEIELCQARSLLIAITGKTFLVAIRQVERPLDPTPRTGTDDSVNFARIEEVTDAVIVSENTGAGPAAGDLILARFVRTRTGWRRDAKVKAKRIR